MKKLTLLLLLFSSFFSFAQKEKKETVYLLFDTTSKEKCIVEDGSGNSQNLNKFRKEYKEKSISFNICNEYFAYSTKKKLKDTCSIKELDNIKFVDLKYIQDKKSKNVMRYNPFEKIYLVEIISKEKIIKYDVTWIDDWVMIGD
ncbi:hypothetical protein IMCC3317_03290 [Kordia antarctica]|uniref:Uncharacterized protein n=1 Tax=Kordia antarctica TaxID=1218801 RepID=A0A7L4ZE19_9FLAO|nr:hypothetical protein [Kordia antarctica]QHI34983.1 hypothetical protein IMCC3317_03290 [Kordia antarctica]